MVRREEKGRNKFSFSTDQQHGHVDTTRQEDSVFLLYIKAREIVLGFFAVLQIT